MHGLKEEGKLAHEDLKVFLKSQGYEPAKHTPGLWKHKTLVLTFTLIVGDFGTKCSNIAQAQHLLDTLRLKHELSTDWTGALHA